LTLAVGGLFFGSIGAVGVVALLANVGPRLYARYTSACLRLRLEQEAREGVMGGQEEDAPGESVD